MTATDDLRKLLTEHGVDWWTEDDSEEPAYYFVTKWFANGCEQTYEEIPAIRSRSLKAYCVTPEQAIAATLGAVTCRVTSEHVDIDGERMTDYSCGCLNQSGWGHNFCPNCGRKVE